MLSQKTVSVAIDSAEHRDVFCEHTFKFMVSAPARGCDDSVKGSVLDNDNYISQSQSPEVAGKLRVENAAAHHESW